MSEISVDPVARTAWVSAGVTSSQLVAAGAAHGLAPLTSSDGGAGVVGHVLGGGLGALGRRFGYAADHVRRVDLVTADGRLRAVSEGADVDADLFWAVRGGGANFGAVTGLAVDRARNVISNARLVFCGVGGSPQRVVEAEKALIGQPPNEDAFAAAAALVSQGVDPHSDIHASARLAAGDASSR